jgi:1,2-phenylacetyl-CoA epoxidase PaaB subunit
VIAWKQQGLILRTLATLAALLASTAALDAQNTELYDPDLWSDEYAFSTRQDRRRFKAIYFTTTAPTSMLIQRGRRGYRRRSQSCWLFGESTISRSIPASRNAIAKTYQTPGFMYSKQAISRLIPEQMRLRLWCLNS